MPVVASPSRPAKVAVLCLAVALGTGQLGNSQNSGGASGLQSREEERALGLIETVFAKYGSACIALFRPELIGLKGEPHIPVETAESLRLEGPEGLLDRGSLAGAIMVASILMSLPDAELTEWQRQIKRELAAPLPNYWEMSPRELADAARTVSKEYTHDAIKAAAHFQPSGPSARSLDTFLLARRMYVLTLAELWQRSETQRDGRIRDYLQTLMRDGRPPNVAHTPQEIPEGRPVVFVLAPPSGDAVMALKARETPQPRTAKKDSALQRTLALRMEVVIATRKANRFEFVRYYIFKKVPDDYTRSDGPPLADAAFLDYRWVMPESAHDRLTWAGTSAALKKNDSFPFQDEMVVRLTPDNPYQSSNYLPGAPLGPARPDEPHLSWSDLIREPAVTQLPLRCASAVAVAQMHALSLIVLAPGVAHPDVAYQPGSPLEGSGLTVGTRPASGIHPMFTMDNQFAIPGTSAIDKALINSATENVKQAVGWLDPLIQNPPAPWVELLKWQPRDSVSGLIGIHFSVSPTPSSRSTAPQLVMSKTASSLSVGIPAEHYEYPDVVFADMLELFVWNLPSGQDRAAHDKLVHEIRKSAGEFTYPNGPLPPELSARLGASMTVQSKSLLADTPDTGTSAGIYDGDIQGHVIGSTVKCFNFLFGKGVPYLTRQRAAAQKRARQSQDAGDSEAVRQWEGMVTTLTADLAAIESLLKSLPQQLKVDFYIKPPETAPARGRMQPPKVPDSEAATHIAIALPMESYRQGPAAVKEALIQELSSRSADTGVRRAVEDFFSLFGHDPANKDDYYAVTMLQLNPQPDASLGGVLKLWSSLGQ